MNGFNSISAPPLYVEIGHGSWRMFKGDSGLEQPIERQENGRLTGACKERLIVSVQTFLNRQSWQPHLRAFCAIGARGVSMRRLALPAAAKAELPQLLKMQIESEFPLSPDELAWGYRLLDEKEQTESSAPGHQQFLIVAVKKEALEDYSEILDRCGVTPAFTLAALARACLYPSPPRTFAALDIGRHQSELISFDRGVPTSVRILSWGGENITRSIQEKLGITREEAEKQKIRLDLNPASIDELAQMTLSATSSAMDSLITSVKAGSTARKIYLTGRSCRNQEIAVQLATGLGDDVGCESVESITSQGSSTAILGLKKSVENSPACPLLLLQTEETKSGIDFTQPALRKWAAIAALFLLGCILLPYLEALVLKPHLSRKLSAAKASVGKLSVIDRELNFLQYFKANQPPYLDALYLMANAASGGTRFDSLSMNRRGEVSLRGNMRNSEEVGQFRSKLISSGFFSSVVVEEQTPTPDRQKVIVRLTAQWKPTGSRENLKIGPSPAEMEKIKAAAKEILPGPPMMNVPSPGGLGLPPQPRETAVPPPVSRDTNATRGGTNTPAPVASTIPVQPEGRKE